MTSFEAGFVKKAKELGLSQKEAVALLNKSSDHPGLATLREGLSLSNEDSEDELEKLSCLFELDEFDREMQKIANSL